ncbi:MAG: RNA polymerase sigma factor, partial [Anaerolineae bacterium]|nr:RNA polymerase sigma factor [Anaerolineae bacterium]
QHWLVEQYADALYRFVYNQVGGHVQEAEDIVQDTFLVALRSIKRFRHQSSLKTWLFGIASNKVKDRWRRVVRHPEVELPEWFPGIGGAEIPEETLARSDVRKMVREALTALPAHYRTALVLKYVEGWPVIEIAGAMGRSEKSVESILVRARRRLAAILEGGL